MHYKAAILKVGDVLLYVPYRAILLLGGDELWSCAMLRGNIAI